MDSEEIRTALTTRLRVRRPEIEQSALFRIHAISDPTDAPDPEYVQGLGEALGAALDYGLGSIQSPPEHPEAPTILLSQARLAARNGVSLDTVLRRYFAGYTLLGDFLIEEAEAAGLQGSALKDVLRGQASVFDALIATVVKEYTGEEQRRSGSAERRRAERVERLLAGELLEAADLDYDFAVHHLGAIATGPGAIEALRELAATMDCRSLTIARGEATVWAWLGSKQPADPAELARLAQSRLPADLRLAIGESGEGLGGWRLTHRQAKAALPIALRGEHACVRYGEVALLASILDDDLLSDSLQCLYLAPLDRERDGGKALRATLRAYFIAERNVSSTAAALGVSRQTVVNRLRSAEARFGRTLASCAAEVEAALRLEELGYRLSGREAIGGGRDAK